jgi:hypothetical protein
MQISSNQFLINLFLKSRNANISHLIEFYSIHSKHLFVFVLFTLQTFWKPSNNLELYKCLEPYTYDGALQLSVLGFIRSCFVQVCRKNMSHLCEIHPTLHVCLIWIMKYDMLCECGQRIRHRQVIKKNLFIIIS